MDVAKSDLLGKFGTAYVLAAAAAILGLFPNSILLFDFTLALGTVIGIYELFQIIYRPVKLRMSQFMIVGILLASCLGTIFFMLGQYTLDAAKYQYWFHNGLLYTQGGLSLALTYDFAAVIALYIVRIFEPAFDMETFLKHTYGRSAERLVLIGVLVVVAAVATGKLGLMGVLSDDSESTISPLAALCVQMLPVLLSLCFSIIINTPVAKKRHAYAGLLLILLLILMMVQRRALLYTFVLCGILWHLRFTITKFRDFFKEFLFGLIGAVIIYIGFLAFFVVRLAKVMLKSNVGLQQQVGLAFALIQSGGLERMQTMLNANAGSRTMTLGYFAGLVDAPRSQLPTYGSELVLAIKLSVPSVFLLGDKIATSPEEITHPLVGIPVFDGPNSILTSGYTDFGLVGVIAYPACAVLLSLLTYRIICIFAKDEAIRGFTLLSLFFMLVGIGVEESLAYTFVTFRNAVLIALLMLVVTKLPKFQQAWRWLLAPPGC